jgi:Sortase domain
MTARVRRISWLNIASGTLIAAGIVIAFIGHNTLRWSAPPLPPAWAGAAHETTLRDVQRAHRERRAALPRSSPVSIDIPSIKVHATVVPLGLNHDGSIAVPPLTRPKETSWYDDGPAPGQPGAATILGHVDAASVGPAVFYDLGEIRPGAKIYVRLRTGKTAIFEAYSVALYSKANFPTRRVFGYTSWPTLRLITCGGIFDPKSGHYLGNIVAFASYVGSRKLPRPARMGRQGPAWLAGADPAGLLNFAPAYSRDS